MDLDDIHRQGSKSTGLEQEAMLANTTAHSGREENRHPYPQQSPRSNHSVGTDAGTFLCATRVASPNAICGKESGPELGHPGDVMGTFVALQGGAPEGQ